jgi:hypothetical protein
MLAKVKSKKKSINNKKEENFLFQFIFQHKLYSMKLLLKYLSISLSTILM